MRIRKRAALFAFTGVLTFLIGAWLTPRDVPQQPRLSPWQVLLSFENRDLEGLSEQSRREVQLAVEALTGRRDSNEFQQFIPSLFRSISNTSGEKRYILVEDWPITIIPSAARMRVHVFDTAGRLLVTDEYSAGWRTVVTEFRVREMFPLQSEALIVDTDAYFGGSAGRQYYVLIGDRPTLAYLEGKGQFQPNNYVHRNLSIGPQKNRSRDDWEKSLDSANHAEALSALIWLGGYHWNGQPAPYDEDKFDAEKVSSLRAKDGVRKRLEELSQSENYWIKAAAEAALADDRH